MEPLLGCGTGAFQGFQNRGQGEEPQTILPPGVVLGWWGLTCSRRGLEERLSYGHSAGDTPSSGRQSLHPKERSVQPPLQMGALGSLCSQEVLCR
jgi:hypothetical protein